MAFDTAQQGRFGMTPGQVDAASLPATVIAIWTWYGHALPEWLTLFAIINFALIIGVKLWRGGVALRNYLKGFN